MSDEFDFDAFMSELEGDLATAPTTKKAVAEVTYKCDHCNGTGTFTGHYRRMAPRKCVPCKGKGFFKRSPEQRQADRAAYKKWKQKKCEEAQKQFTDEHPGLIEFLRENVWSEFVRSLLNSFTQYNSLTDNQIRAARSMQTKMAEKAAQKKKDAEARKVDVDLGTIKAMFDTARESGLKRTKYRAEGLTLSPASTHSRNAGAIYVVRDEDGEYLGKVMDGVFHPVRQATEEDKAAVLRIAEDPKEAAVRWGKKTGRCSCCGRELTNKVSIEAGIGPICATKWGL